VCLSARPVVDRLERDLEGEALVVRLNVMDTVGREVMHTFGVSLVPTFLVFDGAGKLIFRQGGAFPDVGTIKAKVRGETGSIDTGAGTRPPHTPGGA
jgi:hypothetical protein